ncbi:MAG: purine-nucleoside phosphorylase [Desulfuromonadaceae bacterium]|nr:purine-nucleoside phosphorylase [Desulfuromonadaceae bacterium]
MIRSAADLQRAAAAVRSRAGGKPFHTAVVLGSALGANPLYPPFDTLSYRDLPGFPQVSVAGHGGFLALGAPGNRGLLQFCGRFHLYEGFTSWETAATVRLAALLGCRRVLLTNASGAVNPDLRPGDPLFICDHLNLQGDNPLIGKPEAFVDLSRTYELSLFPPLAAALGEEGIVLRQGVLAALSGPSYETPAEVRLLRRMGADAVSMSTVAEAIVGKYLGLEVAALSFVANMAAGVGGESLSHEEVLRRVSLDGERFGRVVRRLIELWEPWESVKIS